MPTVCQPLALTPVSSNCWDRTNSCEWRREELASATETAMTWAFLDAVILRFINIFAYCRTSEKETGESNIFSDNRYEEYTLISKIVLLTFMWGAKGVMGGGR